MKSPMFLKSTYSVTSVECQKSLYIPLNAIELKANHCPRYISLRAIIVIMEAYVTVKKREA
jgi:hypothetical protein